MFLVFFLSGQFFAQSLLPAYAGKPVTGSYEIELQYMSGVPIISYEWGEFKGGETKELICRLAYLGDTPAKVTWSIKDLPEGLDIKVWDQSKNKPRLWEEGEELMFKAGKTRELKIVLRNIDAEMGQSHDFVLRFLTMTPKNVHGNFVEFLLKKWRIIMESQLRSSVVSGCRSRIPHPP
jgi:hypothetical protein